MKYPKLILIFLLVVFVFLNSTYSEGGYRETLANERLTPGSRIYTLKSVGGSRPSFITYYYQGKENDEIKIKYVNSGRSEYFRLPVNEEGQAILKVNSLGDKGDFEIVITDIEDSKNIKVRRQTTPSSPK